MTHGRDDSSRPEGDRSDRRHGKDSGSSEPAFRASRVLTKLEEQGLKKIHAYVRGELPLAAIQKIGPNAQYEAAKLGHMLLREGKWAGARRIFEALSALNPDDGYYYAALGSIAQKENQLEEAEHLYSEALERDPQSVFARSNRGEVRLERGELRDAHEDFITLLQADPEDRLPTTARARAVALSLRERLSNEPPSPRAQSPRVRGTSVPNDPSSKDSTSVPKDSKDSPVVSEAAQTAPPSPRRPSPRGRGTSVPGNSRDSGPAGAKRRRRRG
jgi:tetratricopeptide (TPR) repeat protein